MGSASPSTANSSQPPPGAADDTVVEFRMALDGDRRLEWVSDNVQDVTGLTPAEILRQDRPAASVVHPDDHPLLDLLRMSPGVVDRAITMRWRSRDGGWVWMVHELQVGQDPDGRGPVLTGRARPSARPPEAPDAVQVRALSEPPREIVTVLDADGTIRYESPSIADILGLDPETLVGTSIVKWVHPEDRPLIRWVFDRTRHERGSTERVNLRFRHADGSWHVLDTFTTNLLSDESTRGFVTHSRDVTARERARAWMHEQLRKLEMLAQSRAALIGDLAELQRQKDELAALLVHDFKSPLSTILANTEFLRDGLALEGDQADALHDIESGAKALQRMVLDLLDISLADEAGLVAKPAAVDVGELLHEAADAKRRDARNQGMAIRVVVGTADPCIPVDAGMIARALDNLVDNCLKYGHDGREVVLEAHDGDNGSSGQVLLSVADEGPGVPEADREAIFQKYRRLERHARLHSRASRGLGLVFCRLAAEAHGGRIWVEDNEPSGARFCIALPR